MCPTAQGFRVAGLAVMVTHLAEVLAALGSCIQLQCPPRFAALQRVMKLVLAELLFPYYGAHTSF